jgi:hypothetical protein
MWRIPSQVVAATLGGSVPMVNADITTAALVAAAAYTTRVFPVLYMPVFDIFVAMDQNGELQLECAAEATSTFRAVDPPFAIAAMGPTAFRVAGYRVPSQFVRWTLTNVSGAPCTFTEAAIIARSM